jgi:hypothetical protein
MEAGQRISTKLHYLRHVARRGRKRLRSGQLVQDRQGATGISLGQAQLRSRKPALSLTQRQMRLRCLSDGSQDRGGLMEIPHRHVKRCESGDDGVGPEPRA